MGMAVKGATQHRLVRRAMVQLLDEELNDLKRDCAGRLIRRADLALDRIKKRKTLRACEQQRTGEQPV